MHHDVFVGKAQGKKWFGKRGREGENSVQVDLEKTRQQGQCRIEFTHDVEKMQTCQHGKETLGFIFVDSLRSFKLPPPPKKKNKQK
jgi:hypothetical protein